MDSKSQTQSQSQSQSQAMKHHHQQVQQHHQRRGSTKQSSSRNSESSNLDSPHSPLRFHSPLSAHPADTPPYQSPVNSLDHDNSKAIVLTIHKASSTPRDALEGALSPVAKVGPVAAAARSPGDDEYPPLGRRPRTEVRLSTAALGLRVSELALCLISFSVMAADKTQGWSGDSFDRYKEYRYCLCVNVIGFGYSFFQACDLAHLLVSGKHVIKHHLRRHFELFMDQILAYLLISAASSAATRVDDWQSNWGKDEFTKMASASVVMAFLAFAAFAISSLISGYNLWTENSM